MRLVMVNIYPDGTMAKYLLSSYVLLAYLEKYLPNYKELSIKVLNFSRETEVLGICEQIGEENPDCVAYSCYTWNIEKVLGVVRMLKHRSKAVHVLGGPEITLDMVWSLPETPPVDYYIEGEGEKSFTCLISHLLEGRNHLDTVLSDNNTDNDTANLDGIPSVYLSGTLPDNLYSRQQAFLETQRGCRYRCRYCVYHKHLPSIRYYSESRIIAELDYLIVEKQVMAIRIFDAIFTSDLPRAKRIARHLLGLKNSGIRLPWIYWEFTYRDVDEEFISLVASLKCKESILNTAEVAPLDRPQHYSDLLKDYTVVNSVGIESFNEESLKAVRRPRIDIRKFNNFMAMAKKHNVALKLDIILGLPFETFYSYFQSLEEFIPYFENTDHILNIHLLSILPGSELAELCKTFGIEDSQEAPHTVLSTSSFSERDIMFSTKLSAVLSRILNSPLRGSFFQTVEQEGWSFLQLLVITLDGIRANPEFRETRLVRDDYVDDDYWNGEIYREIPSQWLIEFLRREF